MRPVLDLPAPAVVLCPLLPPDGSAPDWLGRCHRELDLRGMSVIEPERPRGGTDPRETGQLGGLAADPATTRARWVAEVAAAIAQHDAAQLVVVATGAAVGALPALAISQRSARRPIVGYVVVDARLEGTPDPSSDWPQAPVVYVRSPGADDLGWRRAELRGWRCLATDPVAAVLDVARSW